MSVIIQDKNGKLMIKFVKIFDLVFVKLSKLLNVLKTKKIRVDNLW